MIKLFSKGFRSRERGSTRPRGKQEMWDRPHPPKALVVITICLLI